MKYYLFQFGQILLAIFWSLLVDAAEVYKFCNNGCYLDNSKSQICYLKPLKSVKRRRRPLQSVNFNNAPDFYTLKL